MRRGERLQRRPVVGGPGCARDTRTASSPATRRSSATRTPRRAAARPRARCCPGEPAGGVRAPGGRDQVQRIPARPLRRADLDAIDEQPRRGTLGRLDGDHHPADPAARERHQRYPPPVPLIHPEPRRPAPVSTSIAYGRSEVKPTPFTAATAVWVRFLAQPWGTSSEPPRARRTRSMSTSPPRPRPSGVAAAGLARRADQTGLMSVTVRIMLLYPSTRGK